MLLKNGIVISPTDSINEKKDIRIEDGVITEIASTIAPQKGEEILDVSGLVVAPGFVEMHCHLREPGFESKETIETGITSAIAGGYTAVCPMANTKPVVDNLMVLKYVKAQAKEVSGIGYHQVCAMTQGMEGQMLTNFEELKHNGAIAFSDDGRPVEHMKLLKMAFEYAASIDALIILHSEDSSLAEGGVINEGFTSTKLGLQGIPNLAESLAVTRELEVVRSVKDVKVHFAHISTKRSVELIRQAKKEGLKVTCETAPHYFSLCDEDIVDCDARFKMNPPLRSREDVQAIVEGIFDGTIDVIATDHAPHTIKEKTSPIQQSPMGIVGFETALGLTITNLVNKGYITLSTAISLLSSNPAKILKLNNQGSIKKGNISNLCVFNPSRKWEVKASEFKTKCKISPFEGKSLLGKVEYTIINGKITKNETSVTV